MVWKKGYIEIRRGGIHGNSRERTLNVVGFWGLERV